MHNSSELLLCIIYPRLFFAGAHVATEKLFINNMDIANSHSHRIRRRSYPIRVGSVLVATG